MNYSSSTQSSKNAIDCASKPEAQDAEKIISAILLGKYSWACVLMLQRMGYNPMDYIPYRTYKRLMNKQSDDKKKN